MLSEIPKESWCCNNNDIDKLPTAGVRNGQPVLNMDTGTCLMFDKEENKWKEQ